VSRNLNRKWFFLIRRRNIIYLFILFLLLLVFILYNFQKNNISNIFINIIHNFSKNFEYQYKNLEISGLENIDKEIIKDKLFKYFNSPIFLLPLDKISREISELNWVQSVKLTTDYKDTLIINIHEYNPIGIYSFNNKKFYFDKFGKIIDQVDPNFTVKDNLLVFEGPLSNLEAYKLLNIIYDLNLDKIIKIKKIIYVKKRRWDILTNKGVKILLAEIHLKKSIKNFLIIKKNLNKTKFNNIIKFDLRDTNKTILTYRDD
tara:strand:- start:460 stop:1239 length:780 start_codon:yes stop_codon:yes gene_type:complete